MYTSSKTHYSNEFDPEKHVQRPSRNCHLVAYANDSAIVRAVVVNIVLIANSSRNLCPSRGYNDKQVNSRMLRASGTIVFLICNVSHLYSCHTQKRSLQCTSVKLVTEILLHGRGAECQHFLIRSTSSVLTFAGSNKHVSVAPSRDRDPPMYRCFVMPAKKNQNSMHDLGCFTFWDFWR